MSKKTLNKANLEKLGADRLAALVMDLVTGNAALQRRARMELSAALARPDQRPVSLDEMDEAIGAAATERALPER